MIDTFKTKLQIYVERFNISFVPDKAKWNPKHPKLSPITIKINEPVRFVFHVIANPQPTKVTWSHPSNNLVKVENFVAAKVNESTYTLSKTSIRTKDYGKYTVRVTNAAGSSTFIFELTEPGKYNV
jgi:hypothetical protein